MRSFSSIKSAYLLSVCALALSFVEAKVHAVHGGQKANDQLSKDIGVVALRYAKDESTCTGREFAPGYVVTASHCLSGQMKPLLGVSRGARVFEQPKLGVRRVKYCTDYNDQSNSKQVDLAVIELERPLTQRLGIPICGAQLEEPVFQVGYGADFDIEDEEKMVEITDPEVTGSGVLRWLMQRPLSVRFQQGKVKLTLPKNKNIRDGDSGGPLFGFERYRGTLRMCWLGVLNKGGVSLSVGDEGQPLIKAETAEYVDIRKFTGFLGLAENMESQLGPRAKNPCLGARWIDNKDLPAYNAAMCERRSGYRLEEGLGCWPANQEECELDNSLYWDSAKSKCEFKEH